MSGTVFDIAIVILIGAAFGVLAKILRQPTIIAYLATGVLIGAMGVLQVGNNETFLTFSELGIMLLLFLVGLEINYSSFRLVGKASIIIGIGQMALTFASGYGIATLFNFSSVAAAYIGIALSFSSTIIVVKLLTDKRDLNGLYGKISIGMLLVQDFVAILVLVVLSGVSRGETVSTYSIIITIVQAVLLFMVMLFLGRKVLPYIFDRIAQSHELLFLVSLAWVFLVAAGVSKIGFSIEIAGFLAGIALANSSEHHQIAQRIRPLRDFFLIAFFVTLGAKAVFSNMSGLVLPIIVITAFVLIAKPLIVMIMMGISGYRKRTSFLTSMTVAQVSEFSLVLLALGVQVGHIDPAVLSVITAVAVITIVVSSYMMQYDGALYRTCRSWLFVFERKKNVEPKEEHAHALPIVLIGFHRIGESIALGLPREKLLVVEFDPEKAKKLERHGYHYVFGDISDPEIFELAHISDAELVISTSPDVDDNLALVTSVRSLMKRPKVVVRAETEKESHLLYEAGADYVIFPHLTSGQYFGKTIALDPEMKILEQLRAKDMALLKNINSREVV